MSKTDIFLLICFGIALGHAIPFYLSAIVNYLLGRKLMREIMPGKINKKILCKGPHPWFTTIAGFQETAKEIQVCGACGLIAGTDTMVRQETIDMIEENKRIRELEKKLYQDFMNKEDNDIKRYFAQEIQGGLSLDKVLRIHTAGMTFAQRYTLYKAARSKDIEKELLRSDA